MEFEAVSLIHQILKLKMFLFFCMHEQILLTTRHVHSIFLVFAIVPAVPGFRHQQCDDVSFHKAEECAVVPSGMREEGLNACPSISLKPSSHRARPGEGLCLCWGQRLEIHSEQFFITLKNYRKIMYISFKTYRTIQ